MRILQVILAFFPCQIWGGPPQNTLVLSKGLRDRGHDVEVLTTNILDYQTRMVDHSFREEWEGVPVTYLKAYWWGKRHNSLGFIVTPDLWRYRHLIFEADIIHIHGYRHFLFMGASLLALTGRTPYIVQTRGALPSRFGRTELKQLFDRSFGQFILRRAAGAVALSDTEMEDYAGLGVPRSRIAKIFNPLDPTICPQLPEGNEFRRRYGIAPDEKVILFLSRLHERKGLDLLIGAVAGLNRPDFRLCIVGPDNGYQSTAESLIDELGLSESVVITGPLYKQEKFEAYRAANVYVLPTKGGEGLPTTILEASYAGTPIIVTRTTEIAQLVDGKVGKAIDYEIGQLQSALVEILDDPTKQEAFRKQTNLFLEEYFDLNTALDKFENLYEACIQA